MSYWVEYRTYPQGPFLRFRDEAQAGPWDLKYSFTKVENAIAAAVLRMKQPGSSAIYRVVYDDGRVLWQSNLQGQVLFPTNPQEAQMSHEVTMQQPLQIPRTTLIKTLEENLVKERKAREDANAAIRERRKAAEDAVASLSGEELLTVFVKHYGSDLDAIVKMVEEAHETGRLKPKESLPNDKETSLEKLVRVYKLATNEEIEVKPTDQLYPLL